MDLITTLTVEEVTKNIPEFKKSDLDLLRDWHKKQPHLPPMSDSELVLFLHSNYYRIEPTKTTIDTYFTVRTHVPEFFSARDPLGSKGLREIMKVICHVPLPGTTPEGHKVIFARFIDFDPSHYIFSEAMKLLSMFLDLWLHTAKIGTSLGHIILVDMDGIVFGHVARLSPMITKKFLYYLQDALPIRLKGLHFVNTVPFMDTILSLIKPFMKKELSDVLFLHNDLETLNKHVPVDLLPNYMGGKAGHLDDLRAAALQNIEDHRTWFQDEEMRKVNEAARRDKAKNGTHIFGVEGSFKKLDID